MCSTLSDEPRFIALIDSAIASGEVKATSTWKKQSKDVKGREKRRKKAEGEAKEAEKLARELGVHEKLFGGGEEDGKKGKGKGKGKKGEDGGDDDAALRALIQGKQANVCHSLFSLFSSTLR